MNKLKLIFAILFLTSSSVAFSQDYSHDYKVGFGLRLGGYTNSITGKFFVNERGAVEIMAGLGHQAFVSTGLYEYHWPVKNALGLKIYAGGGGHLGFFTHNSTYLVYQHKNEKIYVEEPGHTAVVPGVDGIFGIEYKFLDTPFTIGADVKPFADFHDGIEAYLEGGLHARFVF